MDTLYHYCSNEKMFSILKYGTLRLSDIQKSNDYKEMMILFPNIYYEIRRQYAERPFPFLYKNKKNEDGIEQIVNETWQFIDWELRKGDFTNFVVCFSEAKDSLSQWRGYADNGQGGCIGFSKSSLEQYCREHSGVLCLEKVNYLTAAEIQRFIQDCATEFLSFIQPMRQHFLENGKDRNDTDRIDNLMGYNAYYRMSLYVVSSLRIKNEAFSEEKEWRIFLKNIPYKEPQVVYGTVEDDLNVSEEIKKQIHYLNNRIDFQIIQNDIIPFCPIRFEEFSAPPVQEIWLGPKNLTRICDIQLLLNKFGYAETKIFNSKVTYR